MFEIALLDHNRLEHNNASVEKLSLIVVQRNSSLYSGLDLTFKVFGKTGLKNDFQSGQCLFRQLSMTESDKILYLPCLS